MSVLHKCDVCGKVSERNLNNFSYLCHIESIIDGDAGVYVDGDCNIVSGRHISKDLCNSCYNMVVIESVKKMKELQDLKGEAGC